MRLRQVTIRNFRALRDITVDLDETTVLIGENNTGKTAFLEALKLCLSSAASRRGDVFDDYDHHLSSDQAGIGDAGDTEIVLRFCETTVGEWSPDLVQAISEAIFLDGDLQKVTLRVKASKDAKSGEMIPLWEFLDGANNPLRPRRPVGVVLRDLQQFKPLFYLSAVRDAAREFQPKSTFWGPFLRNPAIPEEIRKKLEEELRELNSRVIGADSRLKDVKSRLEKTAGIVSIRATDAVSIEAVPARARDLLSRSQVSVSSRSGARLPMARHGAGTQSLAVLFLFEAFLSSMLEDIYGVGSVPVVALEEPEAHLHPSAARTLWTAISAMPGQKIVATHSGDLLAKVPLENVRRFALDRAGIQVRRVPAGLLSKDDERKIAIHVRASRGELLFARAWLFVEGPTEQWVMGGIADVLDVDLDQAGVRIIPFVTIGIATLIRLANELGIPWFCLSDGDQSGQTYKRSAVSLLNGALEADRVLALAENTIELHLCQAGFGAPYEANISPQKRGLITVTSADPLYWEQVCKAQGDKAKEELALEAITAMRVRGSATVPPVLRGALDSVLRLAARGSNVP